MKKIAPCFLIGALAFVATQAHAGIFNLTEFVDQGNWSLGLEPEVELTDTAGIAGMVKYTYGLSELSDLQVGIGTGTGTDRFRVSSAFTFDIIPDMKNQVGFGIAVQGEFLNNLNLGDALQLQGIPYVHKSFTIKGTSTADPFIALPIGMQFYDGQYSTIASLNVGSMFRPSENIAYTLELGFNLKGEETTISGGFTYYH